MRSTLGGQFGSSISRLTVYDRARYFSASDGSGVTDVAITLDSLSGGRSR